MTQYARMISILFVATSACGGGSGDAKNQADAGHLGGGPADAAVANPADAAPGTPDAEPAGDPDAGPPAPQACVVPTAGFANVGALTMTVTSADGNVDGSGALASGTPPDNLHIDLFAGFGAFAAGAVTTGTFQLTGDETSFNACGACVTIAGDEVAEEAKGLWMASGGKLTLTSVQGRLTGKLENATFVHVDLANPEMPLGDQCSTSVMNATFDAMITPKPAMP